MNTQSIMNPAVERLVTKLQDVERQATEVWGQFALFAIFHREDAPGLWDLVVSAPWIKPGLAGIEMVAKIVTQHLTPPEAIMIARIVPLPPESTFVRDINKIAAGSQEGLVTVGPLNLGDAEIERGYIFASQHRPAFMEAVG